MKRCSTLLTVKEMHIKTTIVYLYTPMRMAKINNEWQHQMLVNGKDAEELDDSNVAGGM